MWSFWKNSQEISWKKNYKPNLDQKHFLKKHFYVNILKNKLKTPQFKSYVGPSKEELFNSLSFLLKLWVETSYWMVILCKTPSSSSPHMMHCSHQSWIRTTYSVKGLCIGSNKFHLLSSSILGSPNLWGKVVYTFFCFCFLS